MTPKDRAASSTRKPPSPADGHTAIDDWIEASVFQRLHPIVNYFDETIREAFPDVQHAVKWKKAYYGLPDLGWVIELAAYDVSVNIVFLAGAKFDPQPPLGSGESRYVKLQSLEEAQAAEVHEWIEQAGRVSGWR
jgi:hypothetical protein